MPHDRPNNPCGNAELELGEWPLHAIPALGDFFLVLRAIWPRLRLLNDCIILSANDKDELRLMDWITACDGDRSKAEQCINHVHLSDVIRGTYYERVIEAKEWIILLEAYVALLNHELRKLLPDGMFEVRVTGREQVCEDPAACEITFSCIRAGPK